MGWGGGGVLRFVSGAGHDFKAAEKGNLFIVSNLV